jgi:hypothetical protein
MAPWPDDLARPHGRGPAQRPMLAQGAGYVGQQPTPRCRPRCYGPARRLKPVRPAQSPDMLSALPPRSLRTERPGWRCRQWLAAGLGVTAPTARASARYGGLSGQHESGGGSSGKWCDGGVAERYRCDGGRQQRVVRRWLAMLRGTPVAP